MEGGWDIERHLRRLPSQPAFTILFRRNNRSKLLLFPRPRIDFPRLGIHYYLFPVPFLFAYYPLFSLSGLSLKKPLIR